MTHAPNPLRRDFALGVLAVCVGLGVMLCSVALAAPAVRSPRDAATVKPSVVQRAAIPSLPVAAAAGLPAARTLTLAWDASPDAGVTNYSVSYGIAPGVYTNAQNFGTNLTGTISNLAPGVRYYAAAQAHGKAGLVSVFSNEIHAPSNIITRDVFELWNDATLTSKRGEIIAPWGERTNNSPPPQTFIRARTEVVRME